MFLIQHECRIRRHITRVSNPRSGAFLKSKFNPLQFKAVGIAVPTWGLPKYIIIYKRKAHYHNITDIWRQLSEASEPQYESNNIDNPSADFSTTPLTSATTTGEIWEHSIKINSCSLFAGLTWKRCKNPIILIGWYHYSMITQSWKKKCLLKPQDALPITRTHYRNWNRSLQ